jgi:hypothetical protein
VRVIGIILGVIEHLDPTILIDQLHFHVRAASTDRGPMAINPHAMNNLNNMVVSFKKNHM